MTILVEDADFNEETGFCDHYDVYCSEQSEWDDIKTIVNYALENYDRTSLDHFLSRDRENNRERFDSMKELVELISGMDEAPDEIHRRFFGDMREAINHLDELGMEVPGISRERHGYLVEELFKPTETQLRIEARLKERENTPE